MDRFACTCTTAAWAWLEKSRDASVDIISCCVSNGVVGYLGDVGEESARNGVLGGIAQQC